MYDSITWDVENNCFSDEPGLKQQVNGFEFSPLQQCHCFQITWELERTINQRSLSHVAMDTEGVRSGKFEVQVPYFLAGSPIADTFVSLCHDSLLDGVVEGLSH